MTPTPSRPCAETLRAVAEAARESADELKRCGYQDRALRDFAIVLDREAERAASLPPPGGERYKCGCPIVRSAPWTVLHCPKHGTDIISDRPSAEAEGRGGGSVATDQHADANIRSPGGEAQMEARDTASASPPTPSPASPPADWRADLPDDLKPIAAAKGWRTPTEMLKSYAYLERLVGADKVRLPDKDAKGNRAWARWDGWYAIDYTGPLPDGRVVVRPVEGSPQAEWVNATVRAADGGVNEAAAFGMLKRAGDRMAEALDAGKREIERLTAECSHLRLSYKAQVMRADNHSNEREAAELRAEAARKEAESYRAVVEWATLLRDEWQGFDNHVRKVVKDGTQTVVGYQIDNGAWLMLQARIRNLIAALPAETKGEG